MIAKKKSSRDRFHKPNIPCFSTKHKDSSGWIEGGIKICSHGNCTWWKTRNSIWTLLHWHWSIERLVKVESRFSRRNVKGVTFLCFRIGKNGSLVCVSVVGGSGGSVSSSRIVLLSSTTSSVCYLTLCKFKFGKTKALNAGFGTRLAEQGASYFHQ